MNRTGATRSGKWGDGFRGAEENEINLKDLVSSLSVQDPEEAIDTDEILSERLRQEFNKPQIDDPDADIENNVAGFLSNLSNNELLRTQ
ncbi:hypothetical protein [Kiloniella sp.]|uniref:hypothetical protein n=1 Tax=Kiloniella sp. TaxID=1938587 RepID=UPI003A90D685